MIITIQTKINVRKFILIISIFLSSYSTINFKQEKKIISTKLSENIILKQYEYSLSKKYVKAVDLDFKEQDRDKYIEFHFRNFFKESRVKLKSQDSIYFNGYLKQNMALNIFSLLRDLKIF